MELPSACLWSFRPPCPVAILFARSESGFLLEPKLLVRSTIQWFLGRRSRVVLRKWGSRPTPFLAWIANRQQVLGDWQGLRATARVGLDWVGVESWWSRKARMQWIWFQRVEVRQKAETI